MDTRKQKKARLGLEKLDERAVPAPVFFDPSSIPLLNRPVPSNPLAITRATFGPGVNSPFFNNGSGNLNLNRPVAGNPLAITRVSPFAGSPFSTAGRPGGFFTTTGGQRQFLRDSGTLNLNRPVAGNPLAITRQVGVFNTGLPRGAFGGRAALFNSARGFGR